MRITAGELKGRRICSASALKTSAGKGRLRPTSSKVKEAIFNILRDKTEGSIFADLYAGTGAVGMEAMSRGAETVYFVDENPGNTNSLKKLLSGCGCYSKAQVINKTASDFIKYAVDKGIECDVVFLDPPYHSDELENILLLVGEGRFIKKDGVAVAEHFSKKNLAGSFGKLRKKKTYKYGDTMLTLYCLENTGDGT